jgi:hypothetical protein
LPGWLEYERDPLPSGEAILDENNETREERKK